MEFCIATLEHWNSKGFDTTDRRKSTDGNKAIAHKESIEMLIPNYLIDADIQICICPGVELDALLDSPEWKPIIT